MEQGFVIDTQTGRCSPQIDILVRDTEYSAPYLRESGITICDAEATIAIIEVKSTFTSTSLRDALEGISKAWEVLATVHTENRPWIGVWFASCPANKTDDSVLQTIEEQILKVSDRIVPTPMWLMANGRFCCILSHTSGHRKLRYFRTNAFSFSASAIDLLSHTYAHLGSNASPFALDQIEKLVSVTLQKAI